jgi:predicted transcriptional regulator of viral defense system
MGVIPPENFIDGLMKALERPYYVGLLNAAAMQGASHQQPQEYFVFTSLPAMRPIAKNGIKINFISLVHFPSPGTFEKIKTETGYINISPPALTALDLIYFESKIGGLSRSATVLAELIEQIKPADFNPNMLKLAKVSTIQRLGYILGNVINQKKLADAIFTSAQQMHLKFGKIKLDPSCPPEKCLVEKRWNIIVNTTIETDI